MAMSLLHFATKNHGLDDRVNILARNFHLTKGEIIELAIRNLEEIAAKPSENTDYLVDLLRARENL